MTKKRRKSRKRRRNQTNLEFLEKVLFFSILAGIIIIIVLLLQILGQRKKTPVVDAPVEEVQTEMAIEETSTEEASTEEVSSEFTEIEYAPPNYEFQTEEITIKLPNIKEEKTIAWVSDVHMISDNEATDDVKEEFMETVNFRYDFFKTLDDEEMNSKDLWPEIVNYLNYHHFDGVILGGDIMDYCSRKNMDHFVAEFNRLNQSVPTMYLRADHDMGFWYGGEAMTEELAASMHASEVADGDDDTKKCLDFGEFVIIGINRSTKNMTAEYAELVNQWYDEALEQNKPVIIATHVPYASQLDGSLEELSMQVKNKIYYWGGGDYIPYDSGKKYFDKIIYHENTAVKQVLAGHLHHTWDGALTDNVKQHIFTPAYEGSIGIIHIIPE